VVDRQRPKTAVWKGGDIHQVETNITKKDTVLIFSSFRSKTTTQWAISPSPLGYILLIKPP